MSLPSFFRTLLILTVYRARVKHSSPFLAVLCSISSLSLKYIVNYSLFANNDLSTMCPHWFSLAIFEIMDLYGMIKAQIIQNLKPTFIFKLMHGILKGHIA